MNTLKASSVLGAFVLMASVVNAQATPGPSGRLNGTVTEGFETYSIGAGGAVNLGVTILDENTIANGQGPGLVLDGCVYSCANTLQWNGAGYYGMPSKNILANSGDGKLVLSYDVPVELVSLTLHAFNGFPDTTVVRVYDGSGVLIHTSSPISVPGASPVPFSHSATSIGKLEIQSTVWSWSTLIDNHEFGGTGPSISLAGSCPGAVTMSGSGFTAGGNVAVAISTTTGAYVIPVGSCAGTVLGLGGTPSLVTILTADPTGAISLSGNLPAAYCGRSVQTVDLASCTTSNVITL